ncbi:MAG: efflux RND transporter periplasmic adaptor subunit [Phycisphaerales bacterium]|nr:efflux RND transporter periplasmic adaptor subunit [Phycisphaerales bacterium]
MSRKRKLVFRRRTISFGAMLLLAVGLIGFSAMNRPNDVPRGKGPGVEPLAVASEKIRWEQGHSVTRSFVGRVEARQESDVGFEISGMIASIHVEEGQTVTAGDVLAKLDSARLLARRVELVAARDRAKADQELAEFTFRRMTQVREVNAASSQEWNDADKGYLAAVANLKRAEAAIISIDVDIEKTIIRSPFNAVVARRHVDTGRVIDAGTPVLRVLERLRPEVRIGVGGAAVDSMTVGQHFNVAIRDRVVDGVVTAILPTRDRSGRGVDVVITLDAELNGIRSGDLARIELKRSVAERGFWVPLQGLTEGTRGLWSIYLLDSRFDRLGTAVLRRADVEVLHQETDRVFVRGPIAEGRHFAAGGLHRVAAGMVVRTNVVQRPTDIH